LIGMKAMVPLRAGLRTMRVQWLLAAGFLMAPAAAFGQTASAEMNVTATVADYCNIDGAASALLSVACALQTPTATDTVTNQTNASETSAAPAFGASQGGAVAQPQAATPQAGRKLCNSLAATQMENKSFNEYFAAMAKGAAPPRYYSTFQICF